MIDDEDIQKALDWLMNNAEPAAKARAERIYLEEFRKTIKATLMAEKPGEPLGAQERYAYAHIQYKTHLQAMKDAIQRDEMMRWYLAAAEAKLEAWRTMNANARAQGKL